MPCPLKSRTTPYPNRLAYASMTRPITLSGRPGATALTARIVASRVRSTSSRASSLTSPTQKVWFGVAVHAVEERGHVDVDDVAVLDDGRVRDAVADHLVEAGAAGLGEALVAQRRRVGAVVAQELVHHPVDLVGGDARLAVLAGEHDGLGGQPAGVAHPLDHLGRLHGPVASGAAPSCRRTPDAGSRPAPPATARAPRAAAVRGCP